MPPSTSLGTSGRRRCRNLEVHCLTRELTAAIAFRVGKNQRQGGERIEREQGSTTWQRRQQRVGTCFKSRYWPVHSTDLCPGKLS